MRTGRRRTWTKTAEDTYIDFFLAHVVIPHSGFHLTPLLLLGQRATAVALNDAYTLTWLRFQLVDPDSVALCLTARVTWVYIFLLRLCISTGKLRTCFRSTIYMGCLLVTRLEHPVQNHLIEASVKSIYVQYDMHLVILSTKLFSTLSFLV